MKEKGHNFLYQVPITNIHLNVSNILKFYHNARIAMNHKTERINFHDLTIWEATYR